MIVVHLLSKSKIQKKLWMGVRVWVCGWWCGVGARVCEVYLL